MMNYENLLTNANPRSVFQLRLLAEQERRRREKKVNHTSSVVLHPAQQSILAQRKRFNVLALGRRWGKTMFAHHILESVACQGYPVAYLAPRYKLLIEFWRGLRAALEPRTKRANDNERRIEVHGGGVIEGWSLQDDDAARSRKYKDIFIDEAGLIPRLDDIFQTALRPTLTDMHGGAWIAGTPKGRNGFYRLAQRHHEIPEWGFWQQSSYANPYLDPAELDAMRRDMPARHFEQEILAVFLDDGGGVFRNVRMVATEEPKPPQEHHQYSIGVDWGRYHDRTVFAVVDILDRTLVEMQVLDQVPFGGQLTRLCHLHQQYPGIVIAEMNSMGAPLIEQLIAMDVAVTPFTTTHATKTPMIDRLILAFEQQQIAILNDPALIDELEAFEATRTPLGLPKYAAPEGLHDDRVMALALAWIGVDNGTWYLV